MNRQRLASLIVAAAVLAGVVGAFSGGGHSLQRSRTWADGDTAVSVTLAKAKGTSETLSRTWA